MWFGDEDTEFLFDREQDPLHCHDLAESPKHREDLSRFRKVLARRLQENNDPHSSPDGERGRKAIPYEWKLERGTSVNLWNNRGRH